MMAGRRRWRPAMKMGRWGSGSGWRSILDDASGPTLFSAFWRVQAVTGVAQSLAPQR